MKTRLLIIFAIAILGFSTSVFAFESDDPDPLELWASNELIIDGTVIEVDTERTFSEELIRSYQIKVHEYFKGSHKFDLVYAQEPFNNKYFKTGERILFYLYKDNSNSYQVHSSSLKTFENCNARDLIEISPVLPNEKSPISTPVLNENFIDLCIPDYYDVDPDFGGVIIYPAPLKQVNAGIEPQKVQCQDPNKILVLKIDGSPACVKPETSVKLYERGWAEPLGNIVFERSVSPEPESTSVSKVFPTKNYLPPEESFEGVFGKPIIESKFDGLINYTPVKLPEINEQKLELIEIRINANTNVHYLYSSQTINLDKLKNKQNFFDAGGVVVETVYLTNPNGVYQRLANDPDFEIEYMGTVPTRYYFHPEEYNSLLLYPDNQRLVYIQSVEDIDKIKQLASSMKLKNDSLNLDDYLDSNWRLLEPTPKS